MEYFLITEKLKEELEREYGMATSAMTDSEAKDIVEDNLKIEVEYASWSADDEIAYEAKEDVQQEEAPQMGFTEEYLNYIGMSKKDFL